MTTIEHAQTCPHDLYLLLARCCAAVPTEMSLCHCSVLRDDCSNCSSPHNCFTTLPLPTDKQCSRPNIQIHAAKHSIAAMSNQVPMPFNQSIQADSIPGSALTLADRLDLLISTREVWAGHRKARGQPLAGQIPSPGASVSRHLAPVSHRSHSEWRIITAPLPIHSHFHCLTVSFPSPHLLSHSLSQPVYLHHPCAKP